MKNQSRLEKSVSLFAGSLITLFIILLIHRDFPYVGDDYRYFVPHLIDTNLHIEFNGLRIQWYTPSFGGGLPAYPNPQNLEYSLVQWVAYFLDPWTAILLTTAGISLLGYYFFQKVLREKIGLGWKASTLGAMFFLGNGFYIEHMIIGHLGYQLFPLGSIILFLLLDTKNRMAINALLFAFLVAMMIYQAGFYLIIILSLSIVITLIILYLMHPQLIAPQRIILTTAVAMVLAILIGSSKVFAVYSLMRQFPRYVADNFEVSGLQAIIGLFAQFFGVMSIEPILILSKQNTDFLSGALSHITGAMYGIWETDISLSPVLIVFLLAELGRALSSIRYWRENQIRTPRILAFIMLFFLLWITVELTFARGLLFSLIKELPILSSLHVNVRFASVFIMPLVICGAFIMDRFFQQKHDIRIFVILYVLTVAALCTYFFLSSEIHSRSFAISPDQNIRPGETYRITQIANIRDWQVFAKRASSFQTYEPLFGYEFENFKPETRTGSVFEEDNGYLNMTNPVSLVFPRENNLSPFERFKANERDKLELFLQRRQPNWRIPMIQIFLNYLSLITVVVCLVVLLIHLVTTIHKKLEHPHKL